MSIFRGVGGAGDATNDAANQSIIAGNFAAQAAASASDAAASAGQAMASAAAAAASEVNAATSEVNAATSAVIAATAEVNAATSEANAAGSAFTASLAASNASTSEGNAAISATTANNKANEAAVSASDASDSADLANTYALAAANSLADAQSAATSALNAYDSFDDRYLGAKASDPTLDNDGNALLVGAIYFNTVSNVMRVWNGTLWADFNVPSDSSITLAKLAYEAGSLGYRNKLINGGFDVWQRGTSHAASGYGSADRWYLNISETVGTMSQQSHTLGQTEVPGNPKYFTRHVITSFGGATCHYYFGQALESVATLAGETVTVSFYAKADASQSVAVGFYQHFGTGGAGSVRVPVVCQKVALTTSWAKYSLTFNIPSVAGKTLGTDGNDSLDLTIWLDAGSANDSQTDSLGPQSGTFDFSNVQLEVGTTATPFEIIPLSTVLQLCQRYYWTPGSQGYQWNGLVNGAVVHNVANQVYFPVVMRATPTVTLTNVSATGVSTTTTVANTTSYGYLSVRDATSGALTQGSYRETVTANAEIL